MRHQENGETEEELVVSNLRPFTLKVGVHDALDMPILDCALPLRASLLYENGLPVKQTSSSEPLLVGETDVVALQGAATFKLRITTHSSGSSCTTSKSWGDTWIRNRCLSRWLESE